MISEKIIYLVPYIAGILGVIILVVGQGKASDAEGQQIWIGLATVLLVFSFILSTSMSIS